MMPMYPMSPIQQLPDSRNYYPRYHSGKPKVNSTGTSTPIEPSQQAFYMENPQTHVTTTGLERPRQGPKTVEQCNATIMTGAHVSQAQLNGSAVTFNPQEVKQGIPAASQRTPMVCQASVKLDQRPSLTRSGSWNETMPPQEDAELHEPASRGLEREQGEQNQETPVALDRPLVVDGSGLQKRSLELLSTSAPS